MVKQPNCALSDPPWIFVSHASSDLSMVRQVRNYLEDLGAAPLLFHLRALSQPDEFWPLIEREIRARNFFLFCESEAAAQSDWVQRERAVVAPLAASGRVKVGSVNVQGTELDRDFLRKFVSRTRCFISYSRCDEAEARHVVQALKRAGFQTFFDDLAASTDWMREISNEIEQAAQFGFVVVIIAERRFRSHWALEELKLSLALGARIIPVRFDNAPLPAELVAIRTIDATRDIDQAMQELIKTLYAST